MSTHGRERILLTAPYMLAEQERFIAEIRRHGYEVVTPPGFAERLEENELMPLVGEVVGAVVGDDRFTRRVLLSAHRLRVIWKWGTGIDGIDLDAARELGISVHNTPGAFTDPVADTVMGLVLCFARKTVASDRLVRSGRWEKLTAYSLRELTLGIIGAGNIGSAVVRRASAFGMRLLVNDIRQLSSGDLGVPDVSFVPLDELLSRADFVSVNCDLNASSRALIGARELALMKPSAVLINTARGPIVVEAALAEALRTGALGGAGLDVYEREPLPLESELRKMDNVLFSAHSANGSPACWERVHTRTLEGLFESLGTVP